MYRIDNGLQNAVSFMFSKDEGRLAENLVFLELKRRNKEPYYWKNKGEIDFIIKERSNSLTAINVSYPDAIDKRKTKVLPEFEDEIPSEVKELCLLTKDLEKTEGRITFIPLLKWLIC